jgi:hypothetical protein
LQLMLRTSARVAAGGPWDTRDISHLIRVVSE